MNQKKEKCMSAAFDFVSECNPDFVTGGTTCHVFAIDFELCTSSGDYGPNWDFSTDGTFDDWAVNGETPLVCPQCGCKEGNS